MSIRRKSLAVASWLLGTALQLHAQGYIVPNGIVYAGFQPLPGGYEIDVKHDPTNGYYTGFTLNPVGVNRFEFGGYVDVGVRVFLVSPGDPISLQPILAGSYAELWLGNSYTFQSGVPFYVGLYTGNQNGYPPDGIYRDPLFGWARLVNNNGVIQMLGGALEYQGGGIYAGTQTIIPVPEPGTFGLFALGALLLGWRFATIRL